MDDDSFTVGHHQQRRVFQLQGIVGQLFQGQIKVTARLLVLPAKAAPFPDISPAVTTGRLLCAPFKAVVIRVAWLINPQQVAEIIKMGLRPAPLGQLVVFPDGNELFRCHGSLYS